MFFLIALNHPAHYHLFKNLRKELISLGHRVQFVIKDKEILSKLLDNENINYIKLIDDAKITGNKNLSIIRSNILKLIKSDYKFYKLVKKDKPDILIGTDISIAHLSFLTKIPSFVFNEDDIKINKLFCYFTYPFTKYIVSPTICDVGKYNYKRIRYDGYQKLAYLHPNRFNPDESKLDISFKSNPRNYLIRLVAFAAGHDIEKQHSGINTDLLDILIEKLKNHGKVYISSEKKLPEKYSEFDLKIKIADIHHYIASSELFISDSQSMTVEACMLGTPSLRFNTFAGKISVLNELETKYELTHSFNTNEEEPFLNKLDSMLNDNNLRSKYLIRKSVMLAEKIDLNAFLKWLFGQYPDSINELKNNPKIQNQFK